MSLASGYPLRRTMQELIDFLSQYGYWGMTLSAFLAGSVFPFSSEAVLVALQLAGLEPWPLLLSATVGNAAGSMFNYGLGTLGRMEWIERYAHVKREHVARMQTWLQGRGAWVGALCFLPVFGSVLSVTLGLMRANPYITATAITVGKAVRYAIIIFVVSAI